MTPVMGPDELALLEEQRDFLRRSLGDLDREHEAGDLADDDLVTLRADYTRRLQEVEAELAGGAEALLARAPRRPAARTVALGAVILVVALGAGIVVEHMAGARKPGETVSGSIRQSSAGRLAEASALAQQGRMDEALREYDAVLQDDPANIEALAEGGFLRVMLSQDERLRNTALASVGRDLIDRALRLDPANPRTLFYEGLVRLVVDKNAVGAMAAFDEALAHDPPASLKSRIEAFRRSVTSTTVAP